MTAVIGLLNKKGVAIAADSAVTRTRNDALKTTKNGNKMLRASDVLPVSIMITGNSLLLQNPWETIIRKYRQERGHIYHHTVEDVVTDLLDFLSENEAFWDLDVEKGWLSHEVEWFLSTLYKISSPNAETDNKSRPDYPTRLIKDVIEALKGAQSHFHSAIPVIRPYDLERFKVVIEPFVKKHLNNIFSPDLDFLSLLKENIDEIGEQLYKALYAYITYTGKDSQATLIFTGYGKCEKYPALIAINVNEGFDRHINCEIAEKVIINDENPAAICPFAQTDVIDALLNGASLSWLEQMGANMECLYSPLSFPEEDSYDFFLDDESAILMDPEPSVETIVDNSDLRKEYIDGIICKNRKGWVKDLEDYEVKSMADLALTLVDLTGLERVLTFKQEGVGGDVDVAVITKTDGFTWLNRKSWYHHKDINGRYGSLGV